MLVDIVGVKPLEDRKLLLRFEDGVEGTVDLDQVIPYKGVFEPLLDPEKFRQVYVDHEAGTICWPWDADLDPLVLYSAVTGRTIEDLLSAPRRQSA